MWALDTEDDSKGNVKLINFFNGEDHFTFRDRESAIEFLQNRRSNIQVWATNLMYDLWNLFGEYISALEITFIESRVIAAKVIGTKIHFRDTLNHWKMSVQAMGERIGLEKLDPNGNFDNVEYCQRDTEITWRFVVTMKTHYERIGCKLKATIGSTALDYYVTHYGFRKKRLFSNQEIEFMLKGYYGGRTEIFHTRPVEGVIQYFDFNSLYPSVMHDNVFPVLEGARWTRTPDFSREGFVHARIRSPSGVSIPYLPFRDSSHRLLFPLGEFEGHWTYFEIRRALQLGYRLVRTFQAFEFSTGVFSPFKTFVSNLFSARLKAKALGDELLSDSYKLLMNNLYGKFAQGNEITRLIPYDESKLTHLCEKYGDMLLTREVRDYPEHTNVVWAAYTTAYGRDRVFNALTEVESRGGLLMYCDTDSVIFESRNEIFKSSEKLGELKSEGLFSYAHFKLPKLYKLIPMNEQEPFYKAKGVKRTKAKEFFETGKTSFERPTKIREALRARALEAARIKSGKDRNTNARERKITPNYWDTHAKEIRTKYDKRIVKRTGQTEPIWIDGR